MLRTYFALISMFNFSSSRIMTAQHKVMSSKCEAILGTVTPTAQYVGFSLLFPAVNNEVQRPQIPHYKN